MRTNTTLSAEFLKHYNILQEKGLWEELEDLMKNEKNQEGYHNLHDILLNNVDDIISRVSIRLYKRHRDNWQPHGYGGKVYCLS